MREVTGSSPVVPTRFYKKSECEFRTFSFYLTTVFILQTFLPKGEDYNLYDLYNVIAIITAIITQTAASETDIKPVHKNLSKNKMKTAIKKTIAIRPPTIPNEYLSILLRK